MKILTSLAVLALLLGTTSASAYDDDYDCVACLNDNYYYCNHHRTRANGVCDTTSFYSWTCPDQWFPNAEGKQKCYDSLTGITTVKISDLQNTGSLINMELQGLPDGSEINLKLQYQYVTIDPNSYAKGRFYIKNDLATNQMISFDTNYYCRLAVMTPQGAVYPIIQNFELPAGNTTIVLVRNPNYATE